MKLSVITCCSHMTCVHVRNYTDEYNCRPTSVDQTCVSVVINLPLIKWITTHVPDSVHIKWIYSRSFIQFQSFHNRHILLMQVDLLLSNLAGLAVQLIISLSNVTSTRSCNTQSDQGINLVPAFNSCDGFFHKLNKRELTEVSDYYVKGKTIIYIIFISGT